MAATGGAIGQEVANAALVTGDLVINGVPVGPTLQSYDTASSTGRDTNAIAKAEAINKIAEQTGVAIVNSTILTQAPSRPV